MKEFRFSKYNRLYFLIALLLVLPALVMNLCGQGIRLGIDFTGGTLMEFSVGEPFETRKVEEILTKNGYSGSQVAKVASTGADEAADEFHMQIRVKLADDPVAAVSDAVSASLNALGVDPGDRSVKGLTRRYCQMNNIAEEYADGVQIIYPRARFDTTLADALRGALKSANIEYLDLTVDELDGQTRVLIVPKSESVAARELIEREVGAVYPQLAYVSMEHVGATSGALLVKNAVYSLMIALALMLVYIAIRFDWCSGVAAMFGLVHDMLMMCAFMTYFQGLYQINSSFIAAILTIVGYSINDTIVVFDRVRENIKTRGNELTNLQIIDLSQKQSVNRAVNSTLTTLFTIVALYVLGVESIREFAFPLIVGLIAGTWSSLALNGPVWMALANKRDRRRHARAEQTEKSGENAPVEGVEYEVLVKDE